MYDWMCVPKHLDDGIINDPPPSSDAREEQLASTNNTRMLGFKRRQTDDLPVRYVETKITCLDDRVSSVTFGKRKKKDDDARHRPSITRSNKLDVFPNTPAETSGGGSGNLWQRIRSGFNNNNPIPENRSSRNSNDSNDRYPAFPTSIVQQGVFVSELEWPSSLSFSKGSGEQR